MSKDEPSLHEKEKTKLYDAHGHEIILKHPVGFANHPAVPKTKLKEKP